MPPDAPLGLIAGGGRLPVLVGDAVMASGRDMVVLAIDGQNCLLRGHHRLALGQVGKMFRILKAAGVREIVLCGAILAPDMQKLKLDPRGMLLLPRLMAAANQGEDGLMRCIAGTFEEEGYALVRPDQLLADLLVTAGPMTEKTPTEAESRDIARGAEELQVLGARDRGQACIIAGGKVIATEGAEGTDAMLITCYAPHGGVLVKGPKPGQTLALDMPVIGPETVYHAATAGLSGVAVVAGGTLIVERAAVISQADERGLFVTGIGPK